MNPKSQIENPKSVVILGSTGSIGCQALEVAAALPDKIQILGLAAHSNVELFCEQVARWKPKFAVLCDEAAAKLANETLSNCAGAPKVLSGLAAVEELAAAENVDIVLGAMLGAAGLKPTLSAIRAGKTVAIANKETLVAAGEVVMREARERKVLLLPVDSEHSAIAQCLLGEDSKSVERITITASGGPFVEKSRAEIESASATAALKHPTWTMGRKITIDSATLMNKGLEMIEARWLFDLPMEKIDVVVHRQSIVHSFVTFSDSSVKAQLGVPDMKLPIQWALTFPDRVPGAAPTLDILSMGNLTFERHDAERFPAIGLARHAMEIGGVAPAVMNAANEIAVQAFLDGATNFYGVTDCIAHVLERTPQVARPGLEDIFAADGEARRAAREYFQ